MLVTNYIGPEWSIALFRDIKYVRPTSERNAMLMCMRPGRAILLRPGESLVKSPPKLEGFIKPDICRDSVPAINVVMERRIN